MEGDRPYRGPLSKGFGFVEFEFDKDELPEVREARPIEETTRARRRMGIEAIDQTNKGENNE